MSSAACPTRTCVMQRRRGMCSRSYTKKSTKLKNKSPVFTGINKLNNSWK